MLHINGYALTLALACTGAAVWCVVHHHGSRIISAGLTFAAVFFVVAIPAWRDALASVFATGPGMAVLAALALFGGGTYVMEHVRHHHPVRTSVIGVIAGTAVIMAWAMLPELGQRASQLGPRTAAGVGQMTTQIRTGQAAHALPPGARTMILVLALLALGGGWLVLHRHHKSHPFDGALRFDGTPAIGSGQSRRAITAGSSGRRTRRRALPRGQNQNQDGGDGDGDGKSPFAALFAGKSGGGR